MTGRQIEHQKLRSVLSAHFPFLFDVEMSLLNLPVILAHTCYQYSFSFNCFPFVKDWCYNDIKDSIFQDASFKLS